MKLAGVVFDALIMVGGYLVFMEIYEPLINCLFSINF